MQVHLTLLFDDTPDLVDRLRTIIHVAGGRVASEPEPTTLTSLPSPTPVDADADVDPLKLRRQAQAAAARAAKVAKQAPGSTKASTKASEQPGNGADDELPAEDAVEDMGLVPPSMSPGEAKDAALALVREAYSSGHTAEVKVLQKELNVAKFYDVPTEQGHAFFRRAMQLAQSVGIRR